MDSDIIKMFMLLSCLPDYKMHIFLTDVSGFAKKNLTILEHLNFKKS